MPSKQELAEERTDYAEDRTILANERTFAGWIRTGVASAALGLGFQAIFRAVEPTWMAKAGASVFILIAVAVFYLAYRKSCSLVRRMDAHTAEPLSHIQFGTIAFLFGAGTLILGVLLWLI
ncbi:YidH family protein [Henriciella marina]|uniref:YidH family protein n=1 Tax=Henriciella marina TaxID=453851 RepID=UPI00035FFD4E|nr:DUF202 domain-containing protein [Henriciella marina]